MVSSRRPAVSIASIAFLIRLSATCWIWILSTKIIGKVAIAAERHAHALLPGADQRQRGGLLQQRCGVLDRLLGFSLGDELPEPLDDVAGAKRLVRAAVQRLAIAVLVDLSAFSKRGGPAKVARDRRQRLVELVRQRRRHFAHGGQARDVDQLRLQLLHSPFLAPVLRQVADEAGEEAVRRRPWPRRPQAPWERSSRPCARRPRSGRCR